MSYSMRELMDMLKSNDQLSVDDPYIAPPAFLPRVEMGKQSEHDMQRMVIDECDRRALGNPRYKAIFAIPNGQYRKGQRPEPGLKAGVPDLFVARFRDAKNGHPEYYGAFIELKVGDGKPSKLQLEWIERLRNQGYYVTVIWDSVAHVMSVLEWYLA